MVDLIGRNRKGNAILCYFRGETDRPVVVLAKTTEEVFEAIAENWTGYHEGEETYSAMRDIGDNDFLERPSFSFQFEIGYARFEDVFA